MRWANATPALTRSGFYEPGIDSVEKQQEINNRNRSAETKYIHNTLIQSLKYLKKCLTVNKENRLSNFSIHLKKINA